MEKYLKTINELDYKTAKAGVEVAASAVPIAGKAAGVAAKTAGSMAKDAIGSMTNIVGNEINQGTGGALSQTISATQQKNQEIEAQAAEQKAKNLDDLKKGIDLEKAALAKEQAGKNQKKNAMKNDKKKSKKSSKKRIKESLFDYYSNSISSANNTLSESERENRDYDVSDIDNEHVKKFLTGHYDDKKESEIKTIFRKIEKLEDINKKVFVRLKGIVGTLRDRHFQDQFNYLKKATDAEERLKEIRSKNRSV